MWHIGVQRDTNNINNEFGMNNFIVLAFSKKTCNQDCHIWEGNTCSDNLKRITFPREVWDDKAPQCVTKWVNKIDPTEGGPAAWGMAFSMW